MLKIKQTFVMGIHCAGNQSIKTISLKLSNSGTVAVDAVCVRNQVAVLDVSPHLASLILGIFHVV